MAQGSQIIDNENNFLNATLKVISRYQQWLHYHYHIFLILKRKRSNKSGQRISGIYITLHFTGGYAQSTPNGVKKQLN